MKEKNLPTYEKAMRILPKLLNNIPPKVIAEEEKVSVSQVSGVKRMFPLFLGLPRKYGSK